MVCLAGYMSFILLCVIRLEVIKLINGSSNSYCNVARILTEKHLPGQMVSISSVRSGVFSLPAYKEQVISYIDSGTAGRSRIQEIIAVGNGSKPRAVDRILGNLIRQGGRSLRENGVQSSAPGRFKLSRRIDHFGDRIREQRAVYTVHDHGCHGKHGVIILISFTLQDRGKHVQFAG